MKCQNMCDKCIPTQLRRNKTHNFGCGCGCMGNRCLSIPDEKKLILKSDKKLEKK